jgi:hypothetical protein
LDYLPRNASAARMSIRTRKNSPVYRKKVLSASRDTLLRGALFRRLSLLLLGLQRL